MDPKKRPERGPRIRKRTGQYHHGDLKEALVLAAEQLVAETGNVDLSLREVAAAAGVTHAATYRHFQSKVELLAELAGRGFVRLECALTQAISSRTQEEPLVELGAAYVTFAGTSPGLFRVMFHPCLKPFSNHPALLQAATATLEVLRRLVASYCAPAATPATLRTYAMTAWACVHGQAVLLLDQQLLVPFGVEPTSADESTRAVFRTLLSGVGAKNPRSALSPRKNRP